MSKTDVKTKNVPAAQTEMETAVASDKDTNLSDDNACVVCFKNCDIYSIGDCDHPVCYECSTRMRVLCQQNECPICRHVLSKVLFTYDKLPYRELEGNNRSEFYSKKYRIGFCTAAIQQKFFELLDHPCPKCNTPPYRTFQGLRNHVRKEHDLHYCDLCTDHLKIFTFERRCYTQSELNLHRTKGDPDNRSHRGHPLCEYCNKRYLDRDELFRHLRREHYFCHFCDADGCNEFYKDYDALADHFRRDHFLCEEGKCATEQFVGAFRTEIDYKAHIASVHGKSLNKHQARQARTLQLEITLGPRGSNGPPEQDIANMRSRNEEAMYEYIDYVPSSQPRVTIDAGNEEEFPSLSGTATGPNVSLVRPPPPSMRNRSAIAGLARTKENFPALGGGGGGAVNNVNAQRPSNSAPQAATVLKKTQNGNANTRANATAANSNGMVIHVSNRPAPQHTTAAVNKKSNAADFPALPASSKSKRNTRNLEEDILPSTSAVPFQNVAAKHRTLVDDYVSVANPNTFQKIQMVQKEELEAKARRDAEKKNAPKLTTEDFPTLGPTNKSPSVVTNTWAKPVSEKKQREIENRKAKVAPAPILPNNKNNNINKSNNNTNSSNQKSNNHPEQLSKKEKKSKDKKNNQENQPQNNANASAKVNEVKQKEKNNNEQKATTKTTTANNFNGNNDLSATVRAPPGFGENTVKPPPGFLSNVTVNSVAKLPNNLTFTSSLGESYNIVPSTHTYSQPPDATNRNQALVERFRQALKSPQALEEFRQMSMHFRDGVYKTQAYYEHCKSALRDEFDKVFPELLALLPDISKQQELYLAHKQHLNTLSPAQRKNVPSLEVCNHCKQVLISKDFDNHRKLHELKNNFPTLGNNTTKTANNTQRK